MDPLFAALAGGFAGALATGSLSVWRERRRERSSLKVAARLVAAELRTIESRLHVTAGSGAWGTLQERPLPHDEWDAYHGAFASQLPLERWSDLQVTYRLIAAAGASAQLHPRSDRLTQADREQLEAAASAAGAAAEALEGRNGRGSRRAFARAQRLLLRHP